MRMKRQVSHALPFLLAGVGAALVAAAISRLLRRSSFADASVVITGGSRGLGLELARRFAHEGARLSLLARDQEELARARKELAASGADVAVYLCDVASQEQVEETVRMIMGARGRIDVLVNNAGIIQVGPMENMEFGDFKASIDVHAWGPLFMAKAVVPHMKLQGGGRIVNISSIGGLVAVPHLLPYTVGKFALTGLSDGLRAELAKDGIEVTTVTPGLMRTGSHFNAVFKGAPQKEFAWFAICGANPLLSVASRAAAARIVKACRYAEPRLTITFPATALHLINALFPSFIAAGTRLVARLLPRPVDSQGYRGQIGRHCRSSLAPSSLTRRSDRAAELNNEL